MGQEIVARLYFRAAPKAWLHLVSMQGSIDELNVAILSNPAIICINSISQDNVSIALLVAPPELLQAVASLTILNLPAPLDGSVAKVK